MRSASTALFDGRDVAPLTLGILVLVVRRGRTLSLQASRLAARICGGERDEGGLQVRGEGVKSGNQLVAFLGGFWVRLATRHAGQLSDRAVGEPLGQFWLKKD